MNLLEKTKRLCQENNIRPSRSRGQNFLVAEDVYERMAGAARLSKDDTVLEVGPGLGFLTERLAQRAKQVASVELDGRLASIARQRLKAQGISNADIIKDDILEYISNRLRIRGYKVVANLPYNITSVFLRQILSNPIRPASLVLLLQREVAEQIAAEPPRLSLLAVSVQFYSRPELVEYVLRDNFWPAPRVDSAIIRLSDVRPRYELDEKAFFRLIRHGFSAKRKMLKNNLAAGYRIDSGQVEKWLKKADISLKARAQELSLADWRVLFGQIG